LDTEGLTLIDLLRRAGTSTEGGLRLLDRAERASWFPWPEVFRRATNTCGGLQRLGIVPGDRVALIFPTSIEFFDFFFGVTLAGAAPVPLYPPVRLGRLEEYAARTSRMLSSVSPRMVVADERVRRLLGSAVRGVGLELGCRTPKEITRDAGRPIARTDGDLALIQFSSGTTVDPKPVALSHRAIVSQATALNAHWPDTDECVHSGVSWLPLYHDMGLIGCVITALERPGTMTLIPPELFLVRPAVWLRAISKYRATVSVAPNFGYGLCAEKIRDEELEGVDLSSWSIGLNGAEPVVPRVMRRFRRRFESWGLRPETLTPVYGLSEATLAVTFSRPDEPFTSREFDREALSRAGRAVESAHGLEIASVGRPIDGFQVRVVDSQHRDLPEGHVGRLLIRGPSLMEGYYGRPEASAEVLKNGWLDSGDLGFLYRDELYLTGRAKDVLILRGRSHSPTEIEAAVDLVEGVRIGCSVAVSWLPEDADGEVMVLLVEAKLDVPETAYRAIAHSCRVAIAAATGLTANIVEVVAPGTLPRTSSGKLRRQEALRRYLRDQLTPPDRVTPLRLAGAAVRSSLELAKMRWNNRGHDR
jgi:acyl-CoA synthetase (AMP-forming)/AMP-acid ligase II